jgi:hypothetical protein
MKVRVDCTLEIDQKVMQTYIEDMGDNEAIKEFVVRYIVTGGIMCLDESIKNAIGEQHTTEILRWSAFTERLAMVTLSAGLIK